MKDDSFDCTLIAHLRIFLLFYRLLYCLILPENRLFFGIWKVVEIEDSLSNSGISEEFTELVAPGDELEINGVRIQAVPAYNVGKQFHPQANQWVGYLVTMNEVTYYIAGDTDINEDVKKVRCDVAMIPVGGTYTMTAEEAAELAEMIHPKAAIPTHYGSVAGKAEDGQIFADLLKDKINVILKM